MNKVTIDRSIVFSTGCLPVTDVTPEVRLDVGSDVITAYAAGGEEDGLWCMSVASAAALAALLTAAVAESKKRPRRETGTGGAAKRGGKRA